MTIDELIQEYKEQGEYICKQGAMALQTVNLLEELKTYRELKDYIAIEARADERLNTLEEIQSKMTSFHTDMIFEYGADIIETRADAFSKLKEWIEEQRGVLKDGRRN